MVIQIIGQTKKDAADSYPHFTNSVFVESNSRPSLEVALAKLKAFYGEDFEERTISIEEWRDCDAETMRKGGMVVHKI